MSILMFVVNAANEEEKRIVVPVFTESVFNDVILPIAEKCQAHMVCRLGVGIEIGSSDAVHFESELQRVSDNLPITDEVWEYLGTRISNLITEIRRAFESNSSILLFIG